MKFCGDFEKMAALPSPTQVAGSHNAIYEAYYNVVDPNGYGSVGGMEAARFLKKSGLSDVILSKIWDMSDPAGNGCLDKTGVFVALKLVALVQNGRDLSITNLTENVGPPKMGDVKLPKPSKPPPPKSTPLITSLPPTAVDWTIKPTDKEKYEKLFDSLQPLNGRIPGNKGKTVLMESKLPLDTLGKIWELADQDRDGMLDRYEFIAAMHLVYKALEKHAIPNSLPIELMPPVKRSSIPSNNTPLLNRNIDGVKVEVPTVTPAVPPVKPPMPKPVQSVQPTIPWVVSNEEKAKSDTLFLKSDLDKDGFVSGQEIKDVFLQSGVPQGLLAHIWALCDIKQSGKLNNEQFALAMWFVARCLKGIEPPPALTPEMVPPSFRNVKPTEGLLENNNTRYSNPELDMISKDIEELCKERLALETDIAQKEADIKIKTGEIKNLQSELDTLAATLKQLENQKGEAQKRLNDLKAQVDKLRTQAAEQAELVSTQESELNSKKEQLEGLKQEEQKLEHQKKESLQKLETLTGSLQDTQLNISQAKALITQLEEQTRQLTDAVSSCDTVIESGDVTQVPDTALRIMPDFRDPEYRQIGLVNGNNKKQNGFEEDHFGTGFDSDPFKNDPFKSKDAFSNDSFNAAFTESNDNFGADPFGAPFASKVAQVEDPFSAFEAQNSDTQQASAEEFKDPFGCDPFAILHAPTRASGPAPPRPSSPSPALPPKKGKQPPPRPAPPRPAAPPSVKKSAESDAFGSGGGFADFSDFDSKFSDKSKASATNPKGLDFTDDPFRDYRYEDTFNITFDDDREPTETKSGSLDAFGFETANSKSSKFDPFGLEGRQSVPLPASSPVVSKVSGRSSVPVRGELLSEDQQLAWAAKESLRLEEERKKRQLQEQADLELAISLSKVENKKS